LWKVLKQRDVMQYGVVEEFVSSACDTVPGLLTLRHQGKLVLGLRARLILELFVSTSIGCLLCKTCTLCSFVFQKKDVKIQKTVESFHVFVQTLLTNEAEREHFFKEQFPTDYGPKFDQELEKLLWEFLIRLDQLLPVPNLAQTVSWLCDAPPVLEECAQAATQPQLLKILLQHQACLGHLESAASLPPNMGDSILASLSLPPSGKVPSDQSAAERTNCSRPGAATPLVTPVIGLISNGEKASQGGEKSNSKDARGDQRDPNAKFTLVKQKPKPVGVSSLNESRGRKRKQPDTAESDPEEEVISGEKSINRNQRTKEKSQTLQNNSYNRELLNRHISKLGIKKLHLPEDPSICSVFASCLSSNPRVVIKKLSVSSASVSLSGGEGKSFSKEQQQQKSSTWKQTISLDHPLHYVMFNSVCLCVEIVSLSGGDYVADSEDEASKNFKGRLFMKRYYKTKRGTYVPTLREFWKPGTARPDLLSAGSKQRR
uniref:TERF1 (TRF1)-interacting nuclear factor 2 n=1 Tax=Xiphophorus maculatus TaxID=8083 RepID=M3ZHF5_XIPMA